MVITIKIVFQNFFILWFRARYKVSSHNLNKKSILKIPFDVAYVLLEMVHYHMIYRNNITVLLLQPYIVISQSSHIDGVEPRTS